MMIQINTVDLSEFQDPKEVDYQAMKDAGIKNLIIRGSVDLRLDHHAAEHIANAKKYGFNWHLYHYFYNDTNEVDFAVKAARSLGLGKDQILFLDMEDKSLPENWNEQFSIFRKAIGDSFKVGLYCSDSPYNAKFSDSQLKQLGVIRWIASYSYEPKNYDVWQKSGSGSGGFGTYTEDIDRDVDPNNILAISSSNPYVPTSEDKMVRQIILQAGYDTETGIYGLGCSFDNGATFKVYWTIYGQKFYQEDADRFWPFLIDKVKAVMSGSLNVEWSDIQNRPDVATQEDLKNIELKPGPQGPQGNVGPQGPKGDTGATGAQGPKGDIGAIGPQGPKGDTGPVGQQGPQGLPGKDGVTPHIDSTTGDWFIGNQDTGTQAQGPAGKNGRDGVDGQPGKDGQNGITPHIDTATGNWFVGSTDTGIKAQGPQGIQGDPGKDGRNGIDGKDGTDVDLSGYAKESEILHPQVSEWSTVGVSLLNGTVQASNNPLKYRVITLGTLHRVEVTGWVTATIYSGRFNSCIQIPRFGYEDKSKMSFSGGATLSAYGDIVSFFAGQPGEINLFSGSKTLNNANFQINCHWIYEE